MITGEHLYRMRKLKAELEGKQKPARWGYAAALVFLVMWMLAH
jgi:hypothetical protein